MRFTKRLFTCWSLLLALLTFALIPAAAGAAPQGRWVLPASDLSPTDQNAQPPQIATARDGTTTAVWVRSDPVEGSVVQASTRPSGGSFGEPVDVSQTFQNAVDPRIATSPDGTTTVAWLLNSGTFGIQAATRPPGGSFGAPVDLSAAGQDAFESPRITTASDGTTTVVWTGDSGFDRSTIQASTRPPDGSFEAPVDISEDTLGVYPHAPQITTAPDGTTTAIWGLTDGRFVWNSFVVQTSTRPPGGVFGSPVDLSASSSQRSSLDLAPQITSAPDGTTTAFWTSSDGADDVLRASTRAPGGDFGAPVDLSGSGQSAVLPQITTAPDGTATAVWYGFNGPPVMGTRVIVRASTRPPGGSFGVPVDLSAVDGFAVTPQITTSPDGTTTAVWVLRSGSSSIIQASTRPPGGRFRAPVKLSATGQGALAPQVTTGRNGITTAVWLRLKGTNGTVRSTSTEFAASIEKVKASGPAKVRKGRKATYTIKVTNAGNLTATGVRLKVSGRGVKFNLSVGKMAAGKTKTVKVRLKPKQSGKVKATFKVTSSNAGGKSVRKTITVRK